MAQLRVDTTTGSPVITVDAGPINLTAAAASTWQTTAGALTITGAAGINLTGGVTVSGGSPFLVSATGSHRWSAGTVQIDTATDWGTAALITHTGNPIINFGTGRCVFGGQVDIAGPCNITGALRYERLVAIKVAAYPIVIGDSETVFTDEGAAGAPAARALTLPIPQAGLEYTFISKSGNDIEVIAQGGTTIRIAAGVSIAGGNIVSNAIGDTVTLLAINATEWYATAVNGTWTIT